MIRENNRILGISLAIGGLLLLIILRFWTSPIVGRITARGPVGPLEFLLIPVFLALVAAGILLFLWEPETG